MVLFLEMAGAGWAWLEGFDLICASCGRALCNGSAEAAPLRIEHDEEQKRNLVPGRAGSWMDQPGTAEFCTSKQSEGG